VHNDDAIRVLNMATLRKLAKAREVVWYTYRRDNILWGFVSLGRIVPLARRNHVHGRFGQHVGVNAVVLFDGEWLLRSFIDSFSQGCDSFLLLFILVSHSLQISLLFLVPSRVLFVLFDDSLNFFRFVTNCILAIRVSSVAINQKRKLLLATFCYHFRNRLRGNKREGVHSGEVIRRINGVQFDTVRFVVLGNAVSFIRVEGRSSLWSVIGICVYQC
jgi:hypothetical protein